MGAKGSKLVPPQNADEFLAMFDCSNEFGEPLSCYLAAKNVWESVGGKETMTKSQFFAAIGVDEKNALPEEKDLFAAVWHAFDVNNNNKLEFSEWLLYYGTAHYGSRVQVNQALFVIMYTNADGKLSRKEVELMFRRSALMQKKLSVLGVGADAFQILSRGELAQLRSQAKSTEDFVRLCEEAKKRLIQTSMPPKIVLTDEELEKVKKSVAEFFVISDTDKSGDIDYDEFMSVMEKFPELMPVNVFRKRNSY